MEAVRLYPGGIRVKTMHDEWREYRDACYPDGLSEVQSRETQQAFMAGALVASLEIADCSTVPEPEWRARVHTLMSQLIELNAARAGTVIGRAANPDYPTGV
jgi:hypothetical protein